MARDLGPERTCVGCRTTGSRAVLLRVVVVAGLLVVDPGRCLSGRGASVHPDLRCVELADKRRAFSRALRWAGPLDASPVRLHLAAPVRPEVPAGPAHPPDESRSTAP